VITLMYSNYAPRAEHVARLEALVGPGNVSVASDETTALANAGSTEIVLGHRYLRQLLPHARKLRWVQSTAAGHDQLPWRELKRRRVLLSRNPLNADAIAQHVIALAWALQRRVPQAVRAQSSGQWAAPFAMLPPPRTALVLGLGAVGERVAKLLRGLGLQVRGTSRSGSDAQRQACDEFVAPARWRETLGDTDILVLCMPLDASTRGCVGAGELAVLPSHAIVVNVAREALIDRRALLEALRDGRIGGAGLDVLDPVPAADDPLWTTPNLLITPKVAAHHCAMQRKFEAFAEAQIRRFLSAAPLDAVVDLGRPGSD